MKSGRKRLQHSAGMAVTGDMAVIVMVMMAMGVITCMAMGMAVRMILMVYDCHL
jgi:hypothetical protein